ncbi:flagellar hook capping FlgD N-terminal domain-containing protein [Paenibacillus sp. JSM ZJ436]|uniref:Flagellar hook capping protein n=1 Tax=Paenibacillus algicola TaxID=2565926 RepID=A0A4P8XL81_9BACL|nr:flagellar hook capping FlgD N-terminal domain-containing protein [Paenibacillus algicola]QCT03218.1 flagellar hook capping protein [Paenibacillus algicola]
MASGYINQAVWPHYSPSNIQQAGKAEDTSTMGKDQFLSILIAQLRYQDPMQPMQDKEFIAQMAQFTSLEQLMNISSQLTDMRQSLGSASGLIGQKVSWIAVDQSGNSSVKSGIVDSILIRGGMHYASIGAAEIALEHIVQIENAPASAPSPSPETPTPAPGESSNEDIQLAEDDGSYSDNTADSQQPADGTEI